MATFGMHATITAHPGKRDELLSVFRGDTTVIDGCELYVVGASHGGSEEICITELWRDAAAHAASLESPHVRAVIEAAQPLIARMNGTTFVPVAGSGYALER